MKDLTKVFIDLSKCSEEEIKEIGRALIEDGWNVWQDSLNELNRGVLEDCTYSFLVFNEKDNEWQHYCDDDDRAELLYPDFIKLFEGGEVETQVEHTCKYCGCLTTQPDSECYAAPKNKMETLYRKVVVSDRMPKRGGTYLSNEGEVFYSSSHKEFQHNYDPHTMYPDWWLEEIPDPTAQLQADKAELQQWKDSALEVMNQINLQEVGKVLNLKLGSSVSEQILPSIKKLITDKAELLEALEKVLDYHYNGYLIDTEFNEEIESLIQKHKQ